MSSPFFFPPYTPASVAARSLRERAAVVLTPEDTGHAVNVPLEQLMALRPYWNDLRPDQHLKDGGHYRQRRHSCFVLESGRVTQVPHRAHWQPVEYNALHGGIQRWFEPMDEEMVLTDAWQRLLLGLQGFADAIRPSVQRWCVEAHPFRIDTAGGIGRPTPEGAHRDGVDLVVVCLMDRHAIKGGETRVFEAAGPSGQRFTLLEPWTTLLIDDARVIHETTPIQPIDPVQCGHRDTLVMTYRAQSFQGA